MRKIAALFLLLALPLLGMHRINKESALGVQTFRYVDEKRERPLTVELWYPAEHKGLFEQEADSLWVHPNELRGAPVKKSREKYPLILLSHGHQGERRDLSWLAERLVQSGFFVAAIDHYGDMRTHFDVQKSLRFWERSLDFSFLLDVWEKEKGFQEQIDFQRVGFVGYSLGGMTGLALVGARASNVKEVVARLNGKFDVWPEGLFERLDFSDSENSFFESRIKAALLICPAAYPYTGEALKKVTTPVAAIFSVGDEVLPFQEHAVPLIRYLVPKKLKVLREEISHYAFLNRPSELGKKLWSMAHLAGKRAVHDEVGKFSIEFFQEMFFSDRMPSR